MGTAIFHAVTVAKPRRQKTTFILHSQSRERERERESDHCTQSRRVSSCQKQQMMILPSTAVKLWLPLQADALAAAAFSLGMQSQYCPAIEEPRLDAEGQLPREYREYSWETITPQFLATAVLSPDPIVGDMVKL